MRRLIPLSLICTLFFAGVASSTTVIPPSFDALVSGAQHDFRRRSDGPATRSGSARRRAAPSRPRSTFRVEDVWKGASGAVTQLEFLGGTIGETTMEVVGMPTFRVGQRSVLFVAGERGRQPAGRLHARPHARRARLRTASIACARMTAARSAAPTEIGAEPAELHVVDHADAARRISHRRCAGACWPARAR